MLSLLVFGWPALLILWGILAALGTPLLLATGFFIGPLIVAWALAMFLLRHHIRRSGVLGKPAAP